MDKWKRQLKVPPYHKILFQNLMLQVLVTIHQERTASKARQEKTCNTVTNPLNLCFGMSEFLLVLSRSLFIYFHLISNLLLIYVNSGIKMK